MRPVAKWLFCIRVILTSKMLVRLAPGPQLRKHTLHHSRQHYHPPPLPALPHQPSPPLSTSSFLHLPSFCGRIQVPLELPLKQIMKTTLLRRLKSKKSVDIRSAWNEKALLLLSLLSLLLLLSLCHCWWCLFVPSNVEMDFFRELAPRDVFLFLRQIIWISDCHVVDCIETPVCKWSIQTNLWCPFASLSCE